MADVRYTVVADFKVDARKAATGTGKVAANVGKLNEGLTMAVFKGNLLANAVTGIARGMANAAAWGARMFGSWISLGLDFNATMEKTKVGLAAIISTATGVTFADGMQESSKYAKLLVADAAKSVATTRQLFDVFAETAGPILGMGESLEKVRQITNGTIAAASALNVDFAQSRRDIGMMLTGAAGVDVKLFRMLRSSRAITQSTKEWNQMLPVKRLEALTSALGKFQVASEAYALTWAGVSSTFDDLFELFAGAGTESLQGQLKFVLIDINQMLISNYDNIIGWFRSTFEFMGFTVRSAYDSMKGWTIEHWDSIQAIWATGFDYFTRIVLPIFTDLNFWFTVWSQTLGAVLWVLTPVINAMRLMIVVLRFVQDGWSDAMKLYRDVWSSMVSATSTGVNAIADGFAWLINSVIGMLNKIPGVNIAKVSGAGVMDSMGDAFMASGFGAVGQFYGDMFSEFGKGLSSLESLFPERGMGGLGDGDTPGAGATGKRTKPPAPVIDMRGSKIVIKQDFRSANPDRIAIQMMDELSKEVSVRSQSGFAPSFSR